MFCLFFFLDLPVDQEGQRGTQGNDAGHDPDLLPLAHHHGTQDLTSHLKLQTHGQAFGQVYLGVGGVAQEFRKACKSGIDDNAHADKFKYEDCYVC